MILVVLVRRYTFGCLQITTSLLIIATYSLLEESGILNVTKKYTREDLWKILKKKGQMAIGQIFHPYDHDYRVSSIKDGTYILIFYVNVAWCSYGKQLHTGGYEMVTPPHRATSMLQSTMFYIVGYGHTTYSYYIDRYTFIIVLLF